MIYQVILSQVAGNIYHKNQLITQKMTPEPCSGVMRVFYSVFGGSPPSTGAFSAGADGASPRCSGVGGAAGSSSMNMLIFFAGGSMVLSAGTAAGFG
ncbi:MAG: hypothetical protein E7427_08910, partial [Ruminococcaceae bacterium]|nr:hypothetical protein [Oscillospiraceae bacterium]